MLIGSLREGAPQSGGGVRARNKILCYLNTSVKLWLTATPSVNHFTRFWLVWVATSLKREALGNIYPRNKVLDAIFYLPRALLAHAPLVRGEDS